MANFVCEKCGSIFDETQADCAKCHYPYLIESVCPKCGFSSIFRYLSCPRCKALIFGGQPLLFWFTLESAITAIAVVCGWDNEISLRLMVMAGVWFVGSLAVLYYTLQKIRCRKTQLDALNCKRAEFQRGAWLTERFEANRPSESGIKTTREI